MNKFKEGDEVAAKVNPDKVLVVRRYLQRIYFCTVKDDPNAKELVYFERELVGGENFKEK